MKKAKRLTKKQKKCLHDIIPLFKKFGLEKMNIQKLKFQIQKRIAASTVF